MSRSTTDDLLDGEWANTLTHSVGFVIAVIGFCVMAILVRDSSLGLAICCLVYVASVASVFLFSSLSHAVREPRRRDAMRSWDQGMIYLMISGTYTPFAWAFTESTVRIALLLFLWGGAAFGFWSKVIAKHRINSIGTVSYLLLGWIPAIPLAAQVPDRISYACLMAMGLGGVLYTLGVLVLKFDHRGRFLHAVWHLLVIAASACHYFAIVYFVVFQA